MGLDLKKVYICNDSEFVFLSVADKPGICVISGTGSIAEYSVFVPPPSTENKYLPSGIIPPPFLKIRTDEKYIHYIAASIVGYIVTLNPEAVVLQGKGLAENSISAIKEEVKKYIPEESLPGFYINEDEECGINGLINLSVLRILQFHFLKENIVSCLPAILRLALAFRAL